MKHEIAAPPLLASPPPESSPARHGGTDGVGLSGGPENLRGEDSGKDDAEGWAAIHC